jgi:hypothetical protein
VSEQIGSFDLIDAPAVPPYPHIPQPGDPDFDEWRADLENLNGITDTMETNR